MIIERKLTADYDDMIARMTLDRSNPKRCESARRVGLEEGVRQDVACSARKEDSVRQSPSSHRIPFAALGPQSIHPVNPTTIPVRTAEPGDHADRSVSLSSFAGQHNTGPGQHIPAPVSLLRVAGLCRPFRLF